MNVDGHYDVIVIGGGTAGVIAAIQAERAGAKTLLIEKTGMLGGTMTNGGVNFHGLFHAWGRQVIAGIGWELVSRTVAEAGDTLPDFTDYKRGHWLLQVRVNAFLSRPTWARGWASAAPTPATCTISMPATASVRRGWNWKRASACCASTAFYAPGLEELDISHLAPECGVRETAVIRGKRTVTVEDYCSGRLWEEAVCYSFCERTGAPS